jgi:type II secretion system protein N
MANRRQIILQILGYTLYGLAICLVVVYVTFPYDLLQQRLASQFLPAEFRLTVDRSGPAFPPGVVLRGIRLFAAEQRLEVPVLQAETFDIQPALLSLLIGAFKTQINGNLYRGRLHGQVLSPAAHHDAHWQIRGRFADLQLERHPLLQGKKGAFVRGQLAGDVDLTLDPDGKLAQGKIDLQLQSVALLAGQHPGLPLQRDINCSTLQSQLKVTATQMQIMSFTCRGDDLLIQARGVVNWHQPVQNSNLNLNVQIRSETAYKQELGLIATLVGRRFDRRGTLSFRIRGMIRQPRFGA